MINVTLTNRPKNIKNYKKVLIISKQRLRDQAVKSTYYSTRGY